MKELSDILKARRRADADGATLATVVKTEGSSYRRIGAHMLIFSDGKTVGSISGGCLEQDVIENAESVRRSGKPKLLNYDTSAEEDVVFGVGLGCKGVIEIWLEPLADAQAMLDRCENAFAGGQPMIVATVFRGGRAGERSFLNASPEIARTCFRFDEDGNEVFYELIEPPIHLFIFGAGYDAIPLARFAKQLGFDVTVCDRRAAYGTRERFPDADHLFVRPPSELPQIPLEKRVAAVVMSHHYHSDREYVKALLPLPLAYLGLIGPRRRAESMLQELRAEGLLVGDELLQKLHNPIGLDIGAEGPDEIALAILSEINATFAGHGGGFLREKKGPIHAPRTELR